MRATKKAAGRYHHGQLRDALVAAAWSVVDRRGLDALSLRAVADAVGVSHAAPAHHFDGKEDLLDALRAEAWRRFADVLEASTDLASASRAYVSFATAHPRQLELMFRRPRRRASEHPKRAWAALVQRVREAIGPKRAADAAELNAMAFAAWAQVHGASVLLTEGPVPFPAEPLLERVLEAFAGALRGG